MIVEKIALAALSAAMVSLAASFVVFVRAAAPEPPVGPEGRVPAWMELERAGATEGFRSAAPE